MTSHVKRKISMFLLAAAVVTSGGLGRALAIQPGVEGGAEAPQMPPLDDRIDDLFAELQDKPEGFDARVLEKTILNVFSQSGSATTDLLMDRAALSFLEDEVKIALSLLNRVTQLQPGFAEGYHKRSQIYFEQQDYASAMSDLQMVLQLEPRHFVAIKELGFVLLETGDEAGALKAFRMALALNPHMEDVQQAIKKLTPDVEGRGI